MPEHLPRLNAKSLVAEIAGAELGDERLDRRFLEIMEAFANAPSESFAGMCESPDKLEALYRFMRNPHLDWRDLVQPHFEQTALRARQAGSVLVIHDSTKVRVDDDADLRSYINTGKKGFLAHLSLIVGPDGQPLGAGALEVLLRREKKASTHRGGQRMSGFYTAKLKNKEYDRWFRSVQTTGELLAGVPAVHVMDREADSYALLARMSASDTHFVVRWCRNRLARTDEGDGEWQSVHHLLARAKSTKILRKVKVSRRVASTAPNTAIRAPTREQRTARLRFAYLPVTFRRPRFEMPADVPDTLKLNAVYVYEPRPPANVEPVEWILLTTLSIDDAAAVERVVDIYRRRWTVEDFFKALKTGCAYRSRRLTNRHSIFNTLASFIPVAWRALLLRHRARTAASGDDVLNEVEVRVLRALAKQMRWKLPPKLTARDVLALIARLGGHRASSGPPGWRTLMKGTDDFLGTVKGWMLREAQM